MPFTRSICSQVLFCWKLARVMLFLIHLEAFTPKTRAQGNAPVSFIRPIERKIVDSVQICV